MDGFDITTGFMWYFVFLYSTVLHEAGHAWAALRLGDDTAYRGGQVTLDPIPHIRREPIGMLLVPIVSWFMYSGRWMIGWASAPYDPEWARRFPHRALAMAMAGPAGNLIVFTVCGIALHFGLKTGVFIEPERFGFTQVVLAKEGRIWEFLAVLLSIGFALNVLLFVLNMLPFPPLDGGMLPVLFLNRAAAEKFLEFVWAPHLHFIGLIVAWNVCGNVFRPVLRWLLVLVYP